MALENSPDLWKDKLPVPKLDGHKYDRGHAIILGSRHYTGATRLAAAATSRIGSGLVTVISDKNSKVFRQSLPADIIVSEGDFEDINRPSVLLAGPGGCSEAQSELLLSAEPKLAQVLDADAIRWATKSPAQMKVLTPHAGEFVRYFGANSTAKLASEQTNAVMVLKGPETEIASPDGKHVINRVASPYLAKAGTGDVLAGLITGLIAQGMAGFEAACAAVWIHGYAAQRIGPGLIPQDITNELRPILSELIG